MAQIKVAKGDITKARTDAVVNAANTSLLGGGGVDGAIHRAAGKELLAECKTLGGCETGDAKLTKGYNLPARYVIHTVGPVWNGGKRNEEKLLESCYHRCMEVAGENGIRSIAFPCISTGVYRFPKAKAAEIAVDAVRKCLRDMKAFDEVIFVCFGDEDFEIYQRLLSSRGGGL